MAVMRPRQALYLSVFLAPWHGVDLDFGLRLTVFQVFIFPLIVITVLRASYKGIRKSVYAGLVPLLYMVLYGALWSLVQIPFLPETQVIGGTFRTPVARAVIQIAMFIFMIAPLLVVPQILRSRNEIITAGKIYIGSAVCLVLGWIQLLAWYGTGTNPMPIGLIDNLLGGKAEVREGYFFYAELPIFRMNSFGGEPKDLGVSFVIAVLLIQSMFTIWKAHHARKLYGLWFFLAVSTMATLSTTAFILWLLGSVVLVVMHSIFSFSAGKVVRRKLLRRIGFLVVLSVMIAGPIFIAESAGIPIVNLIVERTITRGAESQIGYFEDFDAAIRDYLLDNPARALTGVGFGNMHLHAEPYLIAEVADFAGGGVFVAKAQYLRIISGIGFVGLALFLYWGWRLLRSVAKKNPDLPFLVSFGAATFIVFLAAGTIAPQFYLTAGFLVACLKLSRESIP